MLADDGGAIGRDFRLAHLCFLPDFAAQRFGMLQQHVIETGALHLECLCITWLQVAAENDIDGSL